MTLITYKIIGGIAIWQQVTGRSNRFYRLCFLPNIDGELRLGDQSFSVREGACAIDAAAIADGEYTPTLRTSDGKSVDLERLRVEGGRISPLPTEDQVLRSYMKLTDLLSERLAAAENKILELTALCRGHELFK